MRSLSFDPASAIVFDVVTPSPAHPNTLGLVARDAAGGLLADETWLSIGGGFIVREGAEQGGIEFWVERALSLPLGRRASGARARIPGLSIAGLMRANEAALRADGAAEAYAERVVDAMFACLERGLARSGPLPGGLAVERRARKIFERLSENARRNDHPAHEIMDFVSVYAMAVNEENAAGCRVVTAPTNGAAGVMPAVMRYYRDHCAGATRAGPVDFLTWGVSGQARHAMRQFPARPQRVTPTAKCCRLRRPLACRPQSGAKRSGAGSEAQRSGERSDRDAPAAGYTVASERALARSWLASAVFATLIHFGIAHSPYAFGSEA